MATKPTVVPAPFTAQNVRDLAYQHSGWHDKGAEFGSEAVRLIPGFPDELSDEHKSELFAGYRLRYSENHPAISYVREGTDTFIPVVPKMDTKGRDVIVITADYVLSFTGQAYGKLRESQPNLHGLVGDLREKVNGFCREKLANLVYLVKHGEGRQVASRTRSANKDWIESANKMLDDLYKKIKPAEARGDSTVVDSAKFGKARKAFIDALK